MGLSPDISFILNKRKGRAINFIFALASLKQGARLCRISWNEENSYVFIKDGILLHNRPYNKEQRKINGAYPYVMNAEDIYADDWIVL
jgi:Protein of unknown function (DUF2829)